MSTAATTRPVSAATAARRASSVRGSTSSPTPTSTPLVSKGATARSAVNPRATAVSTGPQRKTSLRIVPNNTLPPGTENEALLTASLKRETDQKEDLLVQVQNKDSTITNLTKENDQLTSALSAAETRLAELYRDQARMEEELASRHEVTDKLRVQLKDFEKEKRDIQRRYNEQTATFEAERQAFYDNEQHLKSRIQSLTQTRKAAPPPRLAPDNISIVSEREYPAEEEPRTPRTAKSMADQQTTPMAISEPQEQTTESEAEQADNEPAEMTALRLELSTLSTSHTSLQTTLQLLQNQLQDLKRVNASLQEENESYNILLREKTLTGQFDIMRQVGRSPSPDDDDGSKADSQSLRSTGRSSTLDRLPEIEEHDEEGQEQPKSLGDELGNALSPPSRDQSPSRNSTRGQRRNKRAQSPTTKGESLGDLPITGPGLDLAAELGRAENKDILEGRVDPANIKSPTTTRGRKKSTARKDDDVPGEVEALKNEVKSLKDANKALSLYASKIIDRIIAHEGFEQVLSVDFVPKTPAPAQEFQAPPSNNFLEPNRPDRRARAQSAIFSSRPQSGMFLRPAAEPLTTFDSFPPPRTPTVPEPPKDTRRSRRSLSFDWKGGFSLFGGGNKDNAANNPNLRPLTLQAGSIATARKLETTEDDNDRKERERLNATMKLMGIDPKDEGSAAMGQSASAPDPPPKTSPPLPPKGTAFSAPGTPGLEAPPPRRPFSWFRKSPAESSASSVDGGDKPAMLTTEALEQAEAVSQIAALDAREQVLMKDISEGKATGYTEMAPRPSLGDEWRSRRSSRKSSGRPKSGGSGSGSTVWSAGMSKAEEEEADADAEVEKEVAAAIV